MTFRFTSPATISLDGIRSTDYAKGDIVDTTNYHARTVMERLVEQGKAEHASVTTKTITKRHK